MERKQTQTDKEKALEVQSSLSDDIGSDVVEFYCLTKKAESRFQTHKKKKSESEFKWIENRYIPRKYRPCRLKKRRR